MKKLAYTMVLALGLMTQIALIPGIALADEAAPAEKPPEWKVDLAAAYNTKYIWRGIIQVDDPVLHPSLNVKKGGLTFNMWGSYNLTSKNKHKNNFTEIDLTVEYAFTFGDFTIPVGVVHNEFLNTTFQATTELYAGLSYTWLVTPSIKIYLRMSMSPTASTC